MNRIKLLSLAMALAMVVFLGLNADAMAQQQPNIGVFDLQKALNDSKKGKTARTGLENKFKKMQNELKTKEAELTKMNNALKDMAEKRSGSPEEFRKKSDELQQKLNAYNEQLGKYNEDMRKSEETALKPLVDKAVQVAGELGKARGYIMVLETQQAGVIFALDTMDMTKDITTAIDK